MNNNFHYWKQFRKVALLTALAFLPMLSQAATISVEGQTQMVLGSSGSFSTPLADFDGNAYVFDKPTMVVTTELQNGLKLEVAIDLETIVRREINLNEDDKEFSSLDNNAARGIIQEIVLAKNALDGKLNISAGYGEPGFALKPSQTISRSIQEENERIAERLFLRADYDLRDGTKVSVAVYDGQTRSAIDLSADYKWSDLMNVQDGLLDNIEDRISGMAAVEQQLGSSNVYLRGAVASTQRSPEDRDNAMALAVHGSAQIGEREFSGMLQYIRHFTDSMKGVDSWMAQVETKIGATSVYARGELTDSDSEASDEKLSGTLGASHQIYSNELVQVDALGEIRVAKLDSQENRDTSLEAFVGLRVSGSKKFDTSKRE